MATIQSDEIQTGMFVANYPHVDTPRRPKEDSDNKDKWKYDVGAIFDLTKDAHHIAALMNIHEQVKRQIFPQLPAGQFGGLKLSIAYPKPEAVAQFPEHYTNKIIFTFRHHNAKDKHTPPGIGKFDPITRTIVDLPQGCGEFYTGCYCIAKVRAFYYNNEGRKGIALGLNSITKLKDGVRFGGGPQTASAAFADFNPDEYDLSSDELFALPGGLPGLPPLPGAGGLGKLGV